MALEGRNGHRLPARHATVRSEGHGSLREVLYTATHSETREKMVVYRALYGERGVWVRPASMWNEVIERDGKTYRRFTYIGEGDA